jgi:hypothetical protein
MLVEQLSIGSRSFFALATPAPLLIQLRGVLSLDVAAGGSHPRGARSLAASDPDHMPIEAGGVRLSIFARFGSPRSAL